ncbi:sugar phosphate isomerase/epimerase family protein [Myceligenerans crystallogenes]|uniref:TIM barrel protein n=1 Tax=Myceligenerans crystallogenes TaxID=316335 RepID=A0ABN2NAK9_9MICO
MTTTSSRDIYFSFFMFTADLRPDDEAYSRTLIDHCRVLKDMGYTGFDVHIAAPPGGGDHAREVASYVELKKRFDRAGVGDVPFTTNVGTTQRYDITSPYEEQRAQALAYLKSRVDITAVLGGDAAMMSGPFLYPYGVFPVTDDGEPIWSDALQDVMAQRYVTARSSFAELVEHAVAKNVTLAIEPVKNWETPGPNMVSEVLDFLESFESSPAGVAVDTAQVVMESRGPRSFRRDVARAVAQHRLHYVHVSAPDRGAVEDAWIPWDVLLRELEPVFEGPYLVEVFNAIPPFDASMRMSRRRFWRPGEDEPTPYGSAYDVAAAALATLRERLAAVAAQP